MRSKQYDYQRIPKDDYDKAIGQLRLQLNGVFAPFRMYGLDVFIPGAKEQAVLLCEQFSMRCRGKQQPIQLPEGAYRPDD